MRDGWIPENSNKYSEYLSELRKNRAQLKVKQMNSKDRRLVLSRLKKDSILAKTNFRCHICGGPIEDKWEADHVLARSGGGKNLIDNYLPAHRLCNNYRWDYLPEEFQEILKLGVWLRTQIERQSPIGRVAADKFIQNERQRFKRRNQV